MFILYSNLLSILIYKGINGIFCRTKSICTGMFIGIKTDRLQEANIMSEYDDNKIDNIPEDSPFDEADAVNAPDSSESIEYTAKNDDNLFLETIETVSDILPIENVNTDNECQSNGNEPFYNETIKEKNNKNKSFKRAVAIACIVSILGGGSLGAGLGAGATIARDILIPLLTGETAETAREDVTFSISEVSSPPISEETEQSVATFSNNTDASVTSYADIINKVEPSVVCISSTMTTQDTVLNLNVPTSGSGILFYESDTKYYIVTNYHVIQNSVNLSVSIEGSDPIPARPVGSDGYNDLAVIYINKSDVKSAGIKNVVLAKFGDSDNMKVGDVVLAIGNALGEGNIATNGIVSAKNKTILIQRNISLTVLQTNAAINPGNSGGPLVNLKGEVIGINTAKISESNTEGMGYSIPSNIAKPIIQEFMDSINKPYMGVQIKTLSAETAKQFNILTAGAFVEEVVEGSPANKAGIQRTDVITGFNGEPILTAEQLTEAVSKGKIGDTVEIKLIRNGKEDITVNVTLEQRL